MNEIVEKVISLSQTMGLPIIPIEEENYTEL